MGADHREPPDSRSPTQTGAKPAGKGDPEPTLRRLGDFELLRELGRGGMGVVYEARQISLNRRIALKVLPPALGLSPQATKRFEREARAAAKLHHTNIVPVHAIGEQDGHNFYAMDLVEGQSLDRVLADLVDQKSNPLLEQTVTRAAQEAPPRQAKSQGEGATTSLSDTTAGSREWFDTVAKMIAEVAAALHYAHGRGVIHRDIKPANLMLSAEGRLCVTDFGLARVVQEPGLTVSGSFLGTPAYMSPEQIAAGRITVDHRTDIYSLGAVLYELLTLQRPFTGQSREEVLTGVMTRDPRPPRRFNTKIPLDLETICLKAMEKDPDRRYRSAGDLARDLEQYLIGGLIAARRASPMRRAAKYVRRHPIAFTAALAGVVVLIVGAVAWQGFARARLEGVERAIAGAQLAMENGNYREGLEQIETALAVDPDLPEARLLRARLLIELDRAEDAVTEAQKMLEEDEGNLAAHLILAFAASWVDGVSRTEQLDRIEELFPREALETADNYYLRSLAAKSAEEAVELLDKALDLDPAHTRVLAARAARLTTMKRFREALADADRMLTASPNSARGWRRKATVYWQVGDDGKARSAIDRAIELDPEDPQNFVSRAQTLCTGDRRSRDAALADMNEAVRLGPENGRLYERRAWCNFSLREYEAAVADAERAIGLGEDRSWRFSAYRRLISSLHRLDRHDETLDKLGELEQIVEDRPNPKAQAGAFRALATLALDIDENDRALSYADRAVELTDDAWSSYTTRARVRRRLKDDAGAQQDCEQAASLGNLETPHAFRDRGSALRQVCRRFDLALVDLNRAIELAPDWPMAYVERAWTKVQAGNFEEGLPDYAKAIELSPGYLRAYTARAYVLLELERWEEALEDANRAIELEPNYRAYLWGGYALVNLERLSEGVTYYERALEYDPENAGILGNLGEMFYQLGRVDDAVDYLERTLELNPQNNYALVSKMNAQAERGRCKQAEEILQTLRDLDFDDWPAAKHNFVVAMVGNVHRNCLELFDAELALAHCEIAVSEEDSVFGPYPGGDSRIGTVLYRMGRYEEAWQALIRASQEEDVDAGDFYFLSMTAFRLGRSAESRAYFDQALEMMEKSAHRNNPDAISLRDEAAGLLSP
jgi:serine/threonine protein kinase/Tfp pilus assembly protein PilF